MVVPGWEGAEGLIEEDHADADPQSSDEHVLEEGVRGGILVADEEEDLDDEDQSGGDNEPDAGDPLNEPHGNLRVPTRRRRAVDLR